jgi:PKD repeat protein
MRTMLMHCRACRLVVPVVVALVTSIWAGCSLEDPGVPALTSPSGFGTAVTLTAAPDSLPRNGSAQSVVTVTVRDSANTPAGGQRLTVSASVGTLSQDEIVTDGDGHATFAFIAPAASAVANEAQIQVVPVSDGGEAPLPRVLTITLTGVSNSTVPTPGFTFVPTTPEKNTSVRFDASATTDESVVCLDACTYGWTFGDGSTGTGRITSHTFTLPGTYTVTLTVTDSAGTSASTVSTVTVSDVAVPTVTLAVDPSPPLADQPATFTATTTVATGHGISSYAWTWGDGNSQTTSAPTVTKAYSEVGTYVPSVTVTDDLGQTATDSLQFTIVGSGVTAEFTHSPTNPTALTTAIQFNGVASTASAGTTIASWQWDFGDGSDVITTTDPTTAHTFDLAGIYIVRLTVEDSAGRTGTTTVTVTVL